MPAAVAGGILLLLAAVVVTVGVTIATLATVGPGLLAGQQPTLPATLQGVLPVALVFVTFAVGIGFLGVLEGAP